MRPLQWVLVVTVFILLPNLIAQADEPPPPAAGSWTLAILPDTQRYVHSDDRLEIFKSQTQWLADNKTARNIQFVLHEGDVTDSNSDDHWQRGKTAMTTLNTAGLPYAIALGNHDIGGTAASPNGSANSRYTQFNDYFAASDFANLGDLSLGIGSGPGVFEAGVMDNSYHLFSAGGEDYVTLALEYGPRDTVLTWANSVLSTYPDRKGIVLTHAYLFHDDTRYDWWTKGTAQLANPHYYGLDPDNTTPQTPAEVNDGEEMWTKLIRGHANVQFVFSGHVLGDGTGRLISQGDHGNDVFQLLADYQEYEGQESGYLRLMEFHPDGTTVQVRTYSPWLDASLTDSQNQFTLTVPEPATLILLLLGGLCLQRRRRRCA